MPAVLVALPYIMAAVAVAGSVYAGVQQQNLADAEEAQQDKNNKNTTEAAIAAMGDLSPAQRDIQNDSAEEGLKSQADYIRNVSQVNLMSGASGTYGGSVDSMLRDLATTRGRNMSQIVKNRDTQLQDIQKQAEQIRYGARANQDTRLFNKPSGFGIAVSAIGAGAQGYSAGSSFSQGAKGAMGASGGSSTPAPSTSFGSSYSNPGRMPSYSLQGGN